MLACQLAKTQGLSVVSTTRNPVKRQALLDNGADQVLIDNGQIAADLKRIYPDGVNKVLELIGTSTLKDSLQCIATRGVVCMTGILGNAWTMADFTPMGDIPSLGRLTVYMGESKNLTPELLQEFIDQVAQGNITLNIDHVFQLDQIIDAHQYMEDNKAKGKIVVKL
jgi:NADPH:quinone reductase-like Zn-dependent oxidoreductase